MVAAAFGHSELVAWLIAEARGPSAHPRESTSAALCARAAHGIASPRTPPLFHPAARVRPSRPPNARFTRLTPSPPPSRHPQKKCDAAEKDLRLESALWHALRARRLERGGPAELLLSKLGRAALAERNAKGDTLLHWAAGKGHKEEIAWLALAGADLLAANARGKARASFRGTAVPTGMENRVSSA